MTFDSDKGVCIVLGGYRGSNSLSDVWAWNGTAWKGMEAVISR